jgi:hypothetical protein
MTTTARESATERLRRLGLQTRGYETNLTRLPIFASSQGNLRPGNGRTDELVEAGWLYGAPVRALSTATMRDGFLLMELCSTFIEAGCPASNRVSFSLGAAARALGASTVGGSQRRRLSDSLLRLRAVSLQATVRDIDGHLGVFTGGLIGTAFITTPGGGKGWVEFSSELAALIRSGFMTVAHAPTALKLLDRDEYAWRLWTFLEGEKIRRRFTYPIFNSTGQVPAIVDLLRMRSTAKRRVAMRIHAAARVIEEIDPRYQICLTDRPRAGWCLEVVRGPYEVGHPAHSGKGTGGRANGQWGHAGGALGAPIHIAGDGPTSYSPSPATSFSTVVPRRRTTGGPESIGSLMDIWVPDVSNTMAPNSSE